MIIMTKPLKNIIFSVKGLHGYQLIKVKNIRPIKDVDGYYVNIWLNNELYDKGMIFLAKNKKELEEDIKEFAKKELSKF